MSDPVSNIDIEDVLTSIRRLVREGGGETEKKTVVMGPGSDRAPLVRLDANQSAGNANPPFGNIGLPMGNAGLPSGSNHPGTVAPSAPIPSALQPEATLPDGPRRPSTRFVLTPALRVVDAPNAMVPHTLDSNVIASRLPAIRIADAPQSLRVSDPSRADAVTESPRPQSVLPIAEDLPLQQDIFAHADAFRALADQAIRPLDGFDFASFLDRPSDFVTEGPNYDKDTPATVVVQTGWGQADVTQADLTQADLTQADVTLTHVTLDDLPNNDLTQTDAPDTGALPDFRLRLADTAAGLEAAVTAQPDDWEPDGSEGVPVMDWSRAVTEDAPVFRSRHAVPLVLDARVDLAPVICADEAADIPTFRHRDRVGTFPDGTADHDSDDRFNTLDDVASAGRQPIAEPEEVKDTDPDLNIEDDLAAYLGRDRMLDEGALRALIVEIVQQELQGNLGERITRNVRKLVRREISRMLSSEEFE